MGHVGDKDTTPPDMTTEQGHHTADLRTLARGSSLSLVGTTVRGVFAFVLVLVVTRGMGAQGAGVFFQVIALFTILSAVEMGADTGLVRFISRSRALGRIQDLQSTILVAISPVAAMSLVLSITAILAAPLLGRLLFDAAHVKQATVAIRVLSPFLLLSAVSDVLAGGTRGFGTVVPYVTVESIGKPLLRSILVAGVLVAGLGSLATLVAWAIPIVVGLPFVALWMLALLRGAKQGQPTSVAPQRPPRALAGEFWRFCVPQGIAALFQTGLRWLDILMVGALRSTGEVGVYAAVSRTAYFGMFAIDAVRLAVAPQLSELLASENRERAESVYRVATWWLMIISWPLYISLAVFAPVVLQAFGPAFPTGQHALLTVSLGMLIATGTGNVSVVLLMGGKSGAVLLTTASALVVNVVVNALLIPRLGMEGAAIAWVASIVAANLLALWQVWRHLRVTPFGAGFAIVGVGSLICFGLLGLLLRRLLGASVPSFVSAVLLCSAAYAGLLFRFRSTLQLTALRHALMTRRGRPADTTTAFDAGRDQ